MTEAWKARLRQLPMLCAALAGAGCLIYGAWLIYAPAGWLMGGILLMAEAITSARCSKPRKE